MATYDVLASTILQKNLYTQKKIGLEIHSDRLGWVELEVQFLGK